MTALRPLQGPPSPSSGDRSPGEGPACPLLEKVALKAKPKPPGTLPAQRQRSASPASVALYLVPVPVVQGIFQIPLLRSARSPGPSGSLEIVHLQCRRGVTELHSQPRRQGDLRHKPHRAHHPRSPLWRLSQADPSRQGRAGCPGMR